MVAGLEGSADPNDPDSFMKSSSVESIHHQTQSAVSTPTQAGPGTPITFRTASIKARPSSSRITTAELEELFHRQGANGAKRSGLFPSSDPESDTATPPTTPSKGPIIYSSIAEMKRKKTKNSTLRGRAVPIPTVASDLRRNFHSSPDLAGLSAALSLNHNRTSSSSASNMMMQSSWTNVHNLHSSLQRLVLPPPNHPPPPPPVVGQLVKVDVSRRSEYDTTQQLQEKLKMQQSNGTSGVEGDADTLSSFRPVVYSAPQQQAPTAGDEVSPSPGNSSNVNPYAKSEKIGAQEPKVAAQPPAPPIPDPDYSLSESDEEADNSVRSVQKKVEVQPSMAQLQPTETSGNSHTSGSSTSSSSITQSSVADEIQRVQAKLRSSKSYPNDFGLLPTRPEGDSSSSGVSSDHEHHATSVASSVEHSKVPQQQATTEPSQPVAHPQLDSSKISSTSSSSSTCSSVIITKLANSSSMDTANKLNNNSVSNGAAKNPPSSTTTNANNNNEEDARSDGEDDQSPSPPLKGFQRHNSLTRKQAALIAANRAKNIQMQRRQAVTLAQLPPPIEADSDEADSGGFMVEPIGECPVDLASIKFSFVHGFHKNLSKF